LGIALVSYASIRKNRTINQTNAVPDSTVFFDPALIKAARKIYRTYCNLNSQINRKPLGVAIDRESYKGQLVFREKPILLPGECFIDINQIEAEFY
jgi:hypothetical protein